MTVREIAEKAGVSIGTVDRVLHNRGRVSPKTKASILAIIEQSGYTPNPIARHLKLNKKYPFAVIMPYRMKTRATGESRAPEFKKPRKSSRRLG
jgi:LacI family transcriptional regulator